MKYLITGVKGQLGYDVVRELKKRNVKDQDIVALDIDDLDITDNEQVNKMISNQKPDIIFHCAAWTNVDNAENNIEMCEKVNVEGTKNIVKACKKVNAKLFYISTDYVFDGTKNGIYEITDIPNPISVYGKTKHGGELAVKEYEKHFIVRISWVFGINGKNFVRTMLKLSETRDTLNVVSDQIGSPTYTVDLSKLLVDMSQTEAYGTYHATNKGYTSWADFAKYIFESNQINAVINPIPSKEYPTKAVRPMNSKMSSISLIENGFYELPNWRNAIDRYNEELKEEKIVQLKR